MININVPSGYFAALWADAYRVASCAPFPKKVTVRDASILPFMRLMYGADGSKGSFIVEQPQGLLEPLTAVKMRKINGKKVYLAFSGGKDSIASAIILKNQGFDVTTCFVHGINRSYHDEMEAAVQVNNILGCEVRYIYTTISGRSPRKENPTKNLLTLALMVDLGAYYGVTNYAIGTECPLSKKEQQEEQDNCNTMYNFSDGPWSLDEGAKTFQAHIPKFKLYRQLIQSGTDSYRTILKHPNAGLLLKKSRSCISPYRFKESWRQHNMRKHNVELMPGRCGSCHKCAIEYLSLCALGHFETNHNYAEHCYQIVQTKGPRVTESRNKTMTKAQAIDYFFDPSIHDNMP